MSGRRFEPGDYVTIPHGLSGFEDITGTSDTNSGIGSLLFGDRIGIIISVQEKGYEIDFGKYSNSCVFLPEQCLLRA